MWKGDSIWPWSVLIIYISAMCEASIPNIGSYSLRKTSYTGFILEAFAIKFIPLLTPFKQNKLSSGWSRIKMLPCFFRDDLVKTSLLSARGTNWHNSMRVTKCFGLIKEMIIKIYFITCNSRTMCDKEFFFVPFIVPELPLPPSWTICGLEPTHRKPQDEN